jgi:histidinol-phosphate aminotransferase
MEKQQQCGNLKITSSNMIVKTIKSFNQATRYALLEKVSGYVSKSKSLEEEVLRLRKKFNLKEIYRFDLGENVDGFSPAVTDLLETLNKKKNLFSKLHEYPDVAHLGLRKALGDMFNVPRQHIVMSAGLDAILDLITRVFFEYKDVFLMPVPGFFLFESYSERMGATPVFLQLDEDDNYAWNESKFEEFKELIVRFRPKIIWISNPNNPTGQIIPENMLLDITDLAASYNCFVVVDEAYQEFIGCPQDSMAKYTNHFCNLIVLHTFSKALGLAGIRLGYLICSNKDIIEAILLHRHHFPVTQLSLTIAKASIRDLSFLGTTQNNTRNRRNLLFENLNTLSTFKYIPSNTNIFMLKNTLISAIELDRRFKQVGIITSFLKITGLPLHRYLRITVRNEKDNMFLFETCKKINEELQAVSG